MQIYESKAVPLFYYSQFYIFIYLFQQKPK